MAGLYNGYLLEFPQIRVDCFTSYNDKWKIPLCDDHGRLVKPPRAQCFLLSHVHSDHLTGLAAPWTGDIHCSYETKAMLLKLETRNEQELKRTGTRELSIKTYDFLKPRAEMGMVRNAKGKEEPRRYIVDHLKPHAYDDPFEVDVGLPEKVTIVLLNANHCPGSAMFLVKNSQKAILHTGDVRADAPMLQSLRRNPLVADFLPSWAGVTPVSHTSGPGRTLDRIYLDTSAMGGTGDMPDKESAVRGVLELMVMYPAETVFLIHAWTWGWEDIIKSVAITFKTKIHVDDYKHDVLAHLPSEPFLRNCLTLDERSTRFHACGPAKCVGCRTWEDGHRKYNAGKMVVHIRIVEVQQATWELDKRKSVDSINTANRGKGLYPTILDCPFARHAPLPELQNLVLTFQPRTISPNTLIPKLDLVDYIVMLTAFDHCLAEGQALMSRETTLFVDAVHGTGYTAKCLAQGVRLPEPTRIESPWAEESVGDTDSNPGAQGSTPLASDRRSNVLSQAAAFGADSQLLQLLARGSALKRQQHDSETLSTDEETQKKPCLPPHSKTEAQRVALRQKVADREASRVPIKPESTMATRRRALHPAQHPTLVIKTEPVAAAEDRAFFVQRPWTNGSLRAAKAASLGQGVDPKVLDTLDAIQRVIHDTIPRALCFSTARRLLSSLQNVFWFHRCLQLAVHFVNLEMVLHSCGASSDGEATSRAAASALYVIMEELKCMATHEASLQAMTDGPRVTCGSVVNLRYLRLHATDIASEQSIEVIQTFTARYAADPLQHLVDPSAAKGASWHSERNLPSILVDTPRETLRILLSFVEDVLRVSHLSVTLESRAEEAQEAFCEAMLRSLQRFLKAKQVQAGRAVENVTDVKSRDQLTTLLAPQARQVKTEMEAKVNSGSSLSNTPRVDTSHLKQLFAKSAA